MKYGQLMFGLLVGCALGALVAANNPAEAGAVGREVMEQVVRDVIAKEPKLILDSVQKYQEDQHRSALKGAGDALKDPAVHAQVFDDESAAFVGPKDAKKVVVEYFDYNCPACKAMYKTVDTVVAKNKDVKVILKEFPIFGPVSDMNSKIGLAVWHHYPDKYYDFHGKMFGNPGRIDEKTALKLVGDLGMDVKKVKAYADSPEAEATLKANRMQGERLMIQGTPTVIVGEEVIGHALGYDDIVSKLGASAPADAAAPAADKPAAEKSAEPKPAADQKADKEEESHE